MSHPFNSLRNDKVQKARVPSITKACGGGGMATGGGVHADEAEDKAQIKRLVKSTALKLQGGAVAARADRPARARGGRLGKKKGTKGHTVNVIVAPHPQAPAMPPVVPGVAAAPPMPPKPPMVPPGPGPLGGPPPGPGVLLGGSSPPTMPHYAGGRTRKTGGAVTADTAGIGKGRTKVQHAGTNKQDTKNVGRGPVITKATGGPITSKYAAKAGMAHNDGTGSGGGKSRLDKAHHPEKYTAA